MGDGRRETRDGRRETGTRAFPGNSHVKPYSALRQHPSTSTQRQQQQAAISTQPAYTARSPPTQHAARYTARSTSTGSTLVALIAGRIIASSATPTSTTSAMTSASASMWYKSPM